MRTDHASLCTVAVFSDRLLLAGIGVALAFAAVIVYLPVMHGIFGTASSAELPADRPEEQS